MSGHAVEGIHHVAIIVRSIERSLPYYVERLGLSMVDDRSLPELGIRLVFLDAGNAMIQLVEPTRPGPFLDHLEEHGEGLHHLCLGVRDVNASLSALTDVRTTPIAAGYQGRLVAFLPDAPNGVRTELLETGSNATASGD